MTDQGGKILVVEDDADVQALLRYNLDKAGFRVLGASAGSAAIPLCREERPDLLLLDIMLPDCNGLEICREIRETDGFGDLPIIFLTARASEADRVFGLEIGANDYVTKPFSVRELIARIRIHLRANDERRSVLRAGDLELDPAGCRVRLKNSDVNMTQMEFRLLEFFMRKPGVVFSRGHLLNAVWGHNRNVNDRTVDAHITRIRHKIETEESGIFIRSVRGFGYSFEVGSRPDGAEPSCQNAS